jgi:ubiquinone/menaquinone biosynthesis C-methylase UbiE
MNTGGNQSTGTKMGIMDRSLYHFYRSPFSKFYNYHDYRLKKFVRAVSESVRPEEVLLDVGAGDCQYKQDFVGRCKYISQDIGDKACYTYDQIDVRSEIYNIPLPSESVDIILCTQVLEHLKYPVKALQEMHRLLKPGGRLCLTVPFAAEEHMLPYDFFRYTRYALDFLMQEQGFLPPEISPQGGRFIFLGKTIKDLFPLLTTRSWLQKTLWLLQAPIVVPTLLLLYLLDGLDRDKNLTQNYDVIARKPPINLVAASTGASSKTN